MIEAEEGGGRMSQFFASNPAGRPAQGPKPGPWRRDVPRTWQEALGLGRSEATPEAARRPAPEAEEPASVREDGSGLLPAGLRP